MNIKYFNAQLPLKELIYTEVLVILQQEQAQKSEEFHYINSKYKIPRKHSLCHSKLLLCQEIKFGFVVISTLTGNRGNNKNNYKVNDIF